MTLPLALLAALAVFLPFATRAVQLERIERNGWRFE